MKKTLLILFQGILCLGLLRAQEQNNPATIAFPGNDSLSCLHFEFSGGKLFMLSDLKRSHKTNYLQVTDSLGNIAATCKVAGNFTQMFKIYNGKIYVGTVDTVWQVLTEKHRIRLVYPKAWGKIKALTMSYLYQAKGVTFQREEEFMNLRSLVFLTYLNDSAKTVTVFAHKMVDTFQVDYIKRNFFMKNNRSGSSPEHYDFEDMSGITTPEYEDYVISRHHYSYDQLINGRKIGLIMNHFNKKFYLFDYTNGNVVHINDSLSKKDIVNLEGMERSNSDRKAVVDETNGEFYSLEKSGQILNLKKYDPETGRLIFIRPLSGLSLSENIRVQGRVLYCIVKPDAASPWLEMMKMNL